MSENPDQIEQLLRKLLNTNSDVIGAALFTTSGLVIRTIFAQGVNEVLIGELSAKIQINAQISVKELSLGHLTRILIDCEEGKIILSKAGKNSILCMIVKPDAKLGMIFLNSQSLSGKIGSRDLNRDEVEKAVNKILSIMKEKETNTLTFEKKYLPELFTNEILRFDTEDGLPNVNYGASIHFNRQGIDIKYEDELVIFVKN